MSGCVCIPCRPWVTASPALWCCLLQVMLGNTHLEEMGSCDDYVTKQGQLQQLQRAGDPVPHLEVCDDVSGQCSNGHCDVHVMAENRSPPNTAVRHPQRHTQLPTEQKGQGDPPATAMGVAVVSLDQQAKTRSYSSVLKSYPLRTVGGGGGGGLTSVPSSSCTSSRVSTPSVSDSNLTGSRVELDGRGEMDAVGGSPDVEKDCVLLGEEEPGEDWEEETDEEVTFGSAPTQHMSGNSVAIGREEEMVLEGRVVLAASPSPDIHIPPPSPARETLPLSNTPPLPLSPKTSLSPFSPSHSHSPIRTQPSNSHTPKAVFVNTSGGAVEEQESIGSPLLRSTSAQGLAPDIHFPSSPPNSLPDVSSPLSKVKMSALTRTSSAPCPLPQTVSSPVMEKQPVPSPSSNMPPKSPALERPQTAEQVKEEVREEEEEEEGDAQSDSSVSKPSSLSIMADEFVPKCMMAGASSVSRIPPRPHQALPATTVNTSQHHHQWHKASLHPPPPPPQQQSLLNQPTFPPFPSLITAAVAGQLQQQLASVAAAPADQRLPNMPNPQLFNQHHHLQIPVPLPTLQHPHPPPPPPGLPPTLPITISPVQHCPPQPVQALGNINLRPSLSSGPNMANKAYHPSVVQFVEKEREKVGALGSALVHQQLLQQQQQQQKGLKMLPIQAQVAPPIHQRPHPQQLTLLPTASPVQSLLPQQLPLQTHTQLATSPASLLLNRQHHLPQLHGLQPHLALFSQAPQQAGVTTPAEVIRRQPSTRPPLLPTPPGFSYITARTTTTPAAAAAGVTPTISPPLPWPAQVRLPATQDTPPASLPLHAPISLANQL